MYLIEVDGNDLGPFVQATYKSQVGKSKVSEVTCIAFVFHNSAKTMLFQEKATL